MYGESVLFALCLVCRTCYNGSDAFVNVGYRGSFASSKYKRRFEHSSGSKRRNVIV